MKNFLLNIKQGIIKYQPHTKKKNLSTTHAQSRAFLKPHIIDYFPSTNCKMMKWWDSHQSSHFTSHNIFKGDNIFCKKLKCDDIQFVRSYKILCDLRVY